MIENKKINIILEETDKRSVEVKLSYSNEMPYSIKLPVENDVVFETKGTDIFESLQSLVTTLNKKKIKLLCQGSRTNLYPSPMLRQSTGGINAYLLRAGVPARIEDIVNIFDPVSEEKLAANDTLTYEKWLLSLDATPEEKEEGINNPGGWVYRIDGIYQKNDNIPPEAIIGAWKVDENGQLTNHFEMNKNYNPADIS